MATRRPDFNLAVRALIEHVARTMPEFRHLEARRILVVAGEARRASHATVKPLAFAQGKRKDSYGREKPWVKVNGRRQLYCITLRPLFFRRTSPRARVATLLHELFHISTLFDGTLDAERTHARMGRKFLLTFRPLEKRLWKELPVTLKRPFRYDGEVRVQQWLEKPGTRLPGEPSSMRRIYSEAHVFDGIVRMKTKGL